MTNAQFSMTKEIQMLEAQTSGLRAIDVLWAFGFRHSFVLGHSDLVIIGLSLCT
jgi:hypothetical protein